MDREEKVKKMRDDIEEAARRVRERVKALGGEWRIDEHPRVTVTDRGVWVSLWALEPWDKVDAEEEGT